MTELQSAPATKSARKTPAAAQKEVRGGGRERNTVTSTRKGVSVDADDSASEYGISDPEFEKSEDDVEVPEDDDILDLLSQSPEKLQEELMKEVREILLLGDAGDDGKIPQLVTVTDESEPESDTNLTSTKSTHYRETSTVKCKPEPGEKKKSKLEVRQELERPRFEQPSNDTEIPNVSESVATLASSDSSDPYPPFKWPEFTDLVYEADGSINLRAQNARIQIVLKTAVLELKKIAVFENVFPTITEKRKMAMRALSTAAYEHKERAILKRLKNDIDYAAALASVVHPEGRISAFRTSIKKLAHQIVVSRFGLKKGCADQVEELLKSHKYIFPTDSNGKVLGDQPFCDEGIVDILHQSMFDGENSIGVRSHEDFVSVLDDNDEPELPVAMVALVATITYAILMDWRSGNPPSSSQVKSFNATLHISVYKAHEATLTRIFECGKKKYHALMARLYKAVSVSQNMLLPAGSLSNFDYLNVDAMSED
ncbi:hypothetical protein BD769DRAFT_1386873 [Suillus cothurnatus]|nr:hypothetical protein BD769DRAFT_1386873 [Suillus cothurnatus]